MTETAPSEQRVTARQEIQNFVASDEPGMVSSFSAQTLTKAAESLYTAQGLQCPVKVLSSNGTTILINREKYLVSQTP